MLLWTLIGQALSKCIPLFLLGRLLTLWWSYVGLCFNFWGLVPFFPQVVASFYIPSSNVRGLQFLYVLFILLLLPLYHLC
jgi:hypothetical protein